MVKAYWLCLGWDGGGQGKHHGLDASGRVSRTFPADNGIFQAGERAHLKEPSCQTLWHMMMVAIKLENYWNLCVMIRSLKAIPNLGSTVT